MKYKLLIKNKFISTIIGSLAVFFGIAFILPLNNFAVYITSYIHIDHSYVTMHFGLFINLIFSFANTFSISLGGYFEDLFGFFKTIIIGYIISFIANFIFIFQNDIWLCYFLTLILGTGTGIATSLLAKNLTLYAPEKKGIISGVMGFGVMILSVIFVLIGEKTINFKGVTLDEDEDFYPPKIAKRTYLYFLIGEFCIPIGLIFALLLIYEYKKEHNQDNSNSISEKKEDEENLKNNEEKHITINDEEKNEEKEKKEEKEEIEENKENEEKKEEKEEKNEEKKENEENKEEKEKKEEKAENKEEKEKKEEKNEENKENKENIENEDEQNKIKMENSKKKIKQVVKTFRYWRITLISFFINISISFMVNTGRTFGALIGINGQALQFAGAIQVLAILILSPILGILVDKKGPLLLLKILAIASIIPGVFLTFFMSYTVVFITCFVLYVLTLVALSVSFGPFIMEVYGIQESVILGGIINGFSKFSDLITTVSAFGFSIDCEKAEKEKDCLKSRYAVMYFISAICCGISSILLFFENRNKFEYENIKEEPLLENNNNDGLVIIPDEVPTIDN